MSKCGGNMKYYKSLILLFIIVSAVTIIGACQKVYKDNPEKILSKFKEINMYQCDVIYKIKNARGEITIDTKQYYNKEIGMRVEFGEDRIQFYKDKKIYVKENKTNRQYDIEKDFDEFYSYAFLEKISKLFINDEEFKYYNEEKEGVNSLVVEFNTLSGNENIAKEVLYIDKISGNPMKAIFYDERGDERGEIIYKNFIKLKNMDKKLFEVN